MNEVDVWFCLQLCVVPTKITHHLYHRKEAQLSETQKL